MSKINLHVIFRHLTSDDNFLSTIIETDHKEIIQKKNRKNGFNLMANMVTEYIPLSPYETQSYALFPSKVKSFLSPDYVRCGIKNVIEKNLNIINISFLNSLNILLRPDIYQMNMDDHTRNLNVLEEFVIHKIQRNSQIDKIKNTKKVQTINKELIKNLSEGKISHDLVRFVINIFEINLLVFDFTKMDVYFYWTHGYKYPYLNMFKDLHCMAYIQGNYEPIMPIDKTISKEQIQKMYVYILTNSSEIKCIPDINLAIQSLLLINGWNITNNQYTTILEKFFKKSNFNLNDY